jgi:hypothetical protein
MLNFKNFKKMLHLFSIKLKRIIIITIHKLLFLNNGSYLLFSKYDSKNKKKYDWHDFMIN